MSLYIRAGLPLGPHDVLAKGARVTVAVDGEVKDPDGKVVGHIVSGAVCGGSDVFVVMEIDDDCRMATLIPEVSLGTQDD